MISKKLMSIFNHLANLSGHLSDVDCVAFHHNCNHIATGSSDRVVRVWDVLTGNSVRVFTGHKVTSKVENILQFRSLKSCNKFKSNIKNKL